MTQQNPLTGWLNEEIQERRSNLRRILEDIELFSRNLENVTLREYQKQVLRTVTVSTLLRQGLTFVVMFPRQSGKNELQAILEVYLLTTTLDQPVEIIKVSPTWKPQGENSMRRLERMLRKNAIANLLGWTKESGHIYRIGKSSLNFLSGSPGANVVGATANLLLECDEAQDVVPGKWDHEFAPMAASQNATRVFWGTAWTSDTLLARELRLAREAEVVDGRQRAFVLTAEEVGQEVPTYRRFVAGEVSRHGRSSPFVRSQYFSEEIDDEQTMFNPRRLALMQGDHPPQTSPQPGKMYALLVDVAGEDRLGLETSHTGSKSLDVQSELRSFELVNPDRDETALTVVEIDLQTLQADPAGRVCQPVYRVVDRRSWKGAAQTSLFDQIRALALHWRAEKVVVDATGIGAGLASFLEKALPGRVISFVFNSATKSRLGWDFLSLIETGRYKEYALPTDSREPYQEEFFRQARLCTMDLSGGSDQRVKWGVPAGKSDPQTGKTVHDDWLLSSALAAVLDREPWSLHTPPLVIQRGDPLEEMVGF